VSAVNGSREPHYARGFPAFLTHRYQRSTINHQASSKSKSLRCFHLSSCLFVFIILNISLLNFVFNVIAFGVDFPYGLSAEYYGLVYFYSGLTFWLICGFDCSACGFYSCL